MSNLSNLSNTSNTYTNPRIDLAEQNGDPSQGEVRLDVTKTLWLSLMLLGGVPGALLTVSLDAVLLFVVFTLFSLCFGHSLGMHRYLIHKSFACAPALGYALVHLGTLAGIQGPLGMLRAHDVRDWAQRQAACHAFFSQRSSWSRDLYWQACCNIHLPHPPQLKIEADILNNPVYQWMQRYWMAQQLPWALLFYLLGGWGWVCWGICSRVCVTVLGHWLIGYLAHNHGAQPWQIDDVAVQGRNVRWVSLLTMGEGWHNSHHAYPGSARIGLQPGQWDPGWWALRALRRWQWVWNIRLPENLPARPELRWDANAGCVGSGPRHTELPH